MRGTRMLGVLLALVFAASAGARTYLPPAGHLFAGLTGGTSLQPYEGLVGKHPAVFEVFTTWNTPTAWLANPYADFRGRLALHLSTAGGYGREGVVSPGGIAGGATDGFLIRLGRDLQRSRRIVYVRIMGEMNAYWNAYAAFSAAGGSRGPANSPRAFVQAWRRTVLILRGGSLSSINRRLRALGLPPVRSRLRRLARPKVAFLWVPQDAGSPETSYNTPGTFWPGGAYVDWVGTDFYGSYPNFGLLSSYYAEFPGKPFVLSEWALYGADDPAFVHRLFAWVRSHPRVRMLNYYQGFRRYGLPSLLNYPAAGRALRAELRSRAFSPYPPEFAHPHRRIHDKHHRRHRPKPEQPPTSPVPAPPPSPPPGNPATCLALLQVCLPQA